MKTNVILLRFRLGWALLGIIGLVLQWITSSIFIPGFTTTPTSWLTFFSYFTILTNLFVTVWFILGFVSLQRGQARWWGDQPEVKGALMVAGTVTILVYWTLLKDIPLSGISGHIANFLLHLAVPGGMWIDWLLTQGVIQRTYWQMMGAWLIFPVAFSLQAEIRGAIVPWYPYFFMDPHAVGGVGPLALWLLVIVILFFAVASLIYWLYNVRSSQQSKSVVKPAVKPASGKVARQGRR
ncbi:MAG TPA: Pr6Pr family membrane protein [Ktedonobacterales bacterium]|nr:Pr6Pr family membrane protein [Ktedonobacterales bacterium]